VAFPRVISHRFSKKALFRCIRINFGDEANDAQLLDTGVGHKF